MPEAEKSPGSGEQSFWERVGIPRILLWSYVGLFLFMIGDGVESNYLAKFFEEDYGFSEAGAGYVILFYGVFVAIGSFLAGTLSTLLGPRRVMVIGAVVWAVFEALFLLFALTTESKVLIYLFYGLRGLGYPLFAFAFLTWINLAVPRERRARAGGWFWFFFTGGLPVVGTLVAAGSIPLVGELGTFWLSFALVVAGATLGILAGKERHGLTPVAEKGDAPPTVKGEMTAGVSILWREPIIGLATSLRTINTGAQYGFFVALPFFLQDDIGFSQSQFLFLIVITFLGNIIWNPISGQLGDRFGWRLNVQWVGGVGCTIGTLLLYWVPLAVGPNFLVVAIVGFFFGICLAGYVPLSAIMVSAVDEDDSGNAMAMYAFAAGASTVLGPLVYSLLEPFFGIGGVMYTFAFLYLMSAVAAHWLRDESDPGETQAEPASQPAIVGAQ